MKLTNTEVKLALKISKVIQERIDITGDTNYRSTDVFPYLVKRGFYEPDKHNGIHFRRFLNKLYKCGELVSLIPQCTKINPAKDKITSEWYFHDAKDKMPKPKNEEENPLKDFIDQEMNVWQAIDIVKMLIAGINPISKEDLDKNDVCCHPIVQEALKTFITPESYEVEIEILKEELANTNEDEMVNISEEIEYDVDKDEWYEQMQKEINSWDSTLKVKNISEQVLNIRKKYPRAYELWSDRENEILAAGWQLFKSKSKVAKLLQRSPSSVSLELVKLEIIDKK